MPSLQYMRHRASVAFAPSTHSPTPARPTRGGSPFWTEGILPSSASPGGGCANPNVHRLINAPAHPTRTTLPSPAKGTGAKVSRLRREDIRGQDALAPIHAPSGVCGVRVVNPLTNPCTPHPRRVPLLDRGHPALERIPWKGVRQSQRPPADQRARTPTRTCPLPRRGQGLRSPASGGRIFEGKMPSLQYMRHRASVAFAPSTHSPTPARPIRGGSPFWTEGHPALERIPRRGVRQSQRPPADQRPRTPHPDHPALSREGDRG